MASHNFHICRAVYQTAREHSGCPKVGVLRLSSDYMIAETDDGSMMVEVDECCKWAAKYKCVKAWQQKFRPDLDE